MKAISVVPILLLLSGCGPSKESEADLDVCRKEAARAFPESDAANADSRSDFQKSCMTAKGYRFSAIAYSCGRGDLYADAGCYVR